MPKAYRPSARLEASRVSKQVTRSSSAGPAGGADGADANSSGYTSLKAVKNTSICRPKEDWQAFKNLLSTIPGPLRFLLFILPVAIYSKFTDWDDPVVFGLNFVAILPLANILGGATEELAGSIGETAGGLLNATFGNAVEMILSVYALRDGLVDVVQWSLMGSILSNLLLVLGMCCFFGGLQVHEQVFNADGANMQATLLLLAVLALAVPSMASWSGATGEDVELWISRGAAFILALLYAMYLFFQLYTHPDNFATESEIPEGVEDDEEELIMSPIGAMTVLFATTGVVAVCSEGLVGSVDGITEKLNISRGFIGIILLPIVGNAAEHATAVTVAMKNKMDLAMGVALGSSTQIALFVVPFTVAYGWSIDVPMDLNFRPVSTGILLFTVLIVGNLTNDGGSNWMEGAMLLAAYLLIAVTFWFIE